MTLKMISNLFFAAFLLLSNIVFAHHAPQCRYTFTAPDAQELAKNYPGLSGYSYVTYVVGGDHLYSTPALSIAKKDTASVTADCSPYLLYATFTEKPIVLSPDAAYRCPTYAAGNMGGLLNQVTFTGPVSAIFGHDIVQEGATGQYVVNPAGAPDLSKYTNPLGGSTQTQPNKITADKWAPVPASQCQNVVDEETTSPNQ